MTQIPTPSQLRERQAAQRLADTETAVAAIVEALEAHYVGSPLSVSLTPGQYAAHAFIRDRFKATGWLLTFHSDQRDGASVKIRGFLPPALPPAEREADRVREVLRHEGTVEAAATRLGWSRWAVRFAIDRYGIDWPPACPRAAAGPCNPPDQREADEPGRTEQHPDLPPEPIPHFIHDGVTDEPEENIGQVGAELRSDPKDDEVALTYDDPPGVEFWADEGDAVVRYALRWSPDDPVWGWTLESRGEDCDEFRTLKDVSERFSQVWPTLEDFKADEEPYHVDRLIEVVARAAGVDLAAAVAAQERDRHEGAQLGAQAMGYGEIDQEQDLAVTTRDEDFEPRSVETDGDDQEGEGHG